MLGVVSAMVLWINLSDLTMCSANKIQGFDLWLKKYKTSGQITVFLNPFDVHVFHGHQTDVSVFLGERRSQNYRSILQKQAQESGVPSDFSQMSLQVASPV